MASAQGINYAEFTYQLLQSYDFWHLHQSEGCRLQVPTPRPSIAAIQRTHAPLS